MKHIVFLFSLIAIIFSACTKWDTFVQEDESLGYTKMDFTNLQVGDKFYFQEFYGNDYRLGDPADFTYEDKYLELEILEELADSKFLFSEVVYSLKESEGGEAPIIPTMEVNTDTLFNYFQVGKDSLRIIFNNNAQWPQSNLFLAEYLSLEKYRLQEIEIIGWKTSHHFVEHDIEFFTSDLKLRGLLYDTLNVYVNNETLSYHSAGSTYIYEKNNGLVRSSFYTWSNFGIGWDRIIDPF